MAEPLGLGDKSASLIYALDHLVDPLSWKARVQVAHNVLCDVQKYADQDLAIAYDAILCAHRLYGGAVLAAFLESNGFKR